MESIYYKQNWGNTNIKNPAFIFGCNSIQNKLVWKKINGYDQELKSNGEDIDYSVRVRDKGLSTFYCHDAKCFTYKTMILNHYLQEYGDTTHMVIK